MFEYNKLRGKIIEVFGSQKKFAKAIGLSERTVSKKMRGLIPWTQPEMFKAVQVLNEPISMIDVYFYTLKVQ